MITVTNGFPLNDTQAAQPQEHTYTVTDPHTIINIPFPILETGGGFKLVQPVGNSEYFAFSATPGTLSTDDIDFGGVVYKNVLSRTTAQGDYYHLYRNDARITVMGEAFGKYAIGVCVTRISADFSSPGHGEVYYKTTGTGLGYSFRTAPGSAEISGTLGTGDIVELVPQTHHQYIPRWLVVTETIT